MSETLIRLAGPVAGTGADATLYTVPGSTTVDLRTIHIVNNDGTNVQVCKMSIGADGAGTRILPTGFEVDQKGVANIATHITLNAGETVHWNGNSNLVVTLSGVAITP